MAEFVRIAGANEIPNGEGRVFEIGGKMLAVFNCSGTFYVIDNACKHQGGPLGEGELDGHVVVCPWHGWTYDVTTGLSPDDPGVHVGTYPVKVEGDAILVAL